MNDTRHNVTVVRRRRRLVPAKVEIAWPKNSSPRERVAIVHKTVVDAKKNPQRYSPEAVDFLLCYLEAMLADLAGVTRAKNFWNLAGEKMVREVDDYRKNNGGNQEAAIRALTPQWEKRWGKRADVRQHYFKAKRRPPSV